MQCQAAPRRNASQELVFDAARRSQNVTCKYGGLRLSLPNLTIPRDTIGGPGVPPCRTCARAQVECVLVASKRGGRRIPKRASSPGYIRDRWYDC